MSLRDLIAWFAGGSNGYMSLVHCMNHDWPWITVTVILDLAVAVGYILIALHWRRNERILPDSPAKSALGSMKNIFIFCGICGYVFIPIKMFWPAWRLYDAFLVVLVYLTWRYALSSRQLSVVYNEINRIESLAVELEESKQEARRKSHFLNALSHDLKTPLNGLMLQAHLAQISLTSEDPTTLRESLEQIKACARTTSDLLNGFLELGRLDWAQEPLKIEEFPVRQLLEFIEQEFRERAEKKALILEVVSNSPLILKTDRAMLLRIVRNLLDNAIRFTAQGVIKVAVEATTGGMSLHVADSGEGIALNNQARVFDDFTQVHNSERDSRKGFGLGLAVARRIARQLGGHITLESETDRGSRFTLRLPATSLAGLADSRRIVKQGSNVAAGRQAEDPPR